MLVVIKLFVICDFFLNGQMNIVEMIHQIVHIEYFIAINIISSKPLYMKLDMLSYQKGVKVPGRNIRNPDYNRVFDETAKRIYEVITGRECLESVKVM